MVSFGEATFVSFDLICLHCKALRYIEEFRRESFVDTKSQEMVSDLRKSDLVRHDFIL